jgi:hypothetical protein
MWHCAKKRLNLARFPQAIVGFDVQKRKVAGIA